MSKRFEHNASTRRGAVATANVEINLAFVAADTTEQIITWRSVTTSTYFELLQKYRSH